MEIFIVYSIIILLALVHYGQSCSLGLSPLKYSIPRALKIALFFAVFALGMFFLGVLLGGVLGEMIEKNLSLISAFILLLVGVKIFLDAKKSKAIEKIFDDSKYLVLTGIAFAVSLSHFLAGIAFGMIDVGLDFKSYAFLVFPAVFLFSFAGIFLGKKRHLLTSNKINLLSGAMIFALALFIIFRLYEIL
jgi:putative Mn2+ efflux pump MntP